MGQLWGKPGRAVALVVAVSLLAGCEAQLKPNTLFHLSDFLSSVTDASGTIQATLVQGPAPSPNGGPAASVSGIAVMINGGSSQQTVSAPAGFTRVIVAVDGLTDYYELLVPSGTSQGLILGASPNAVAGNLFFTYAVGDAGTLGAYARQQVRFLRVGTGDIQISVAWTDTADVDLHVIDPNGEHIYFGHARSPNVAASGGTLDLDGNAACNKNTFTDGSPPAWVSVENVVWPTGRAIPGTYKVFLDYWLECSVAKTDWVVTIQRRGASPQVFTGSFVGAASGVPDDTVSVFTY
jgi:hypothetical protein